MVDVCTTAPFFFNLFITKTITIMAKKINNKKDNVNSKATKVTAKGKYGKIELKVKGFIALDGDRRVDIEIATGTHSNCNHNWKDKEAFGNSQYCSNCYKTR